MRQRYTRRTRWPLFFILASAALPVYGDTPKVSPQEIILAFYDYDAKLPLNPTLRELPNQSEKQAELRARYTLSYDSANDQRVTAIFTVPKRFAPPYPAVLLLAGSGGHKDTDYIRIASDLMNTLGYATLSIDAQYHGDRARPGRTGDIHLIHSTTNRNAWIQTVIDLRRAVDYLLSRPDIDPKKIGYLGFSQGGMIGGTFIGIEPRIKAACLAIPGGGFVDASKRLKMWKETEARRLQINALLTDPIYFIGRFSPRPLLILSAKKDELIPKFMTDALYNAARMPKQIIWYNAGHALTEASIRVVGDLRAFFTKHLGKRQEMHSSVSD